MQFGFLGVFKISLGQLYLLAFFTIVLFAIFIVSLIFVHWLRDKRNLTGALNMSLFLITLPKKNKEDEKTTKNEKEIISVMEQFYSSLSSVKNKRFFSFYQPYLVFEIATSQKSEEISFYLATPRSYESIVEKQINGFFPEALVEKVNDYNIFNPNGTMSAAYFKLEKNHILPFKTYQMLESDPLNEITNALSKINKDDEGAAIQIIFKPSPQKFQELGNSVAREMQKGKSFKQALAEKNSSFFLLIFKELFGIGKSPVKNNQQLEKDSNIVTPGQQEIIKALEGKAGKISFSVNVRLLVSAPSKERSEELLNHLESAFTQFNSPNLNQLRAIHLKRKRALEKMIYNFSFRIYDKKQEIILNTEELTSIFHFPISTTETPKIKFLKARTAAPPANLPQEGVILGKNVYRGIETIVRLKKNDRRRHLYIIGQTGTGKSAFLKNMLVQDIRNGDGVGILDPHGDLVEDILGLVPKERAEDVILVDPANLKRPLGLNMLEYNPDYPEQKTFAVNELINIFDKLYDLKQTGGPMFEQYTRNSLLLLMDDPSEKFTLMEVPRVLSDKDFRDNLLARCKNVIVKDFWQKEAEKAGGEAALANMVPYITSKFNVFTSNDYMRPIIGQAKSSIDFRKVMDEKKILLVNLSKGRLGETNSALLGLIITGKLLMASFSRIDLPEESRQDFYLYMDEFQNFATDSISTILSEARKYRLCLTVAHQFIGQLDEKIRRAVFGNAGSMVSFRVGAEDTEFLAKQFEPVFDAQDLINIDNFNAYAKIMIDGQVSKPFNFSTYPPEKGNPEIRDAIKELSSLIYGRDRSVVEKEIYNRLQ